MTDNKNTLDRARGRWWQTTDDRHQDDYKHYRQEVIEDRQQRRQQDDYKHYRQEVTDDRQQHYQDDYKHYRQEVTDDSQQDDYKPY